MKTITLTAADFRLHLPRILEKVAYQERRVLVQRYGHEMVAIVSLEDYQYLEENKPRRSRKRKPEFERTHAAAEALGLMGTSTEDAVAKVLEIREKQRVLAERVREEEERRKAAEKAARKAAEEAAREEEAKRAAHRERVRFCMQHSPDLLGLKELVEMYREVYDDRSDLDTWLWRHGAWRCLEAYGRTEGLKPPPEGEPPFKS